MVEASLHTHTDACQHDQTGRYHSRTQTHDIVVYTWEQDLTHTRLLVISLPLSYTHMLLHTPSYPSYPLTFISLLTLSPPPSSLTPSQESSTSCSVESERVAMTT